MKDARASNITPGHVRAFQMVTSGMFDNVTLWSCSINGEPGVAIVVLRELPDGCLEAMPLFVAVTQGMDIDFEGERSGHGGGGGPRRPAERAFDANKAITMPRGTA